MGRFYQFVWLCLLSDNARTIWTEALIAGRQVASLFTNFPWENFRFNQFAINSVRRAFTFPGNSTARFFLFEERSSLMSNFLGRKRRLFCRELVCEEVFYRPRHLVSTAEGMSCLIVRYQDLVTFPCFVTFKRN